MKTHKSVTFEGFKTYDELIEVLERFIEAYAPMTGEEVEDKAAFYLPITFEYDDLEQGTKERLEALCIDGGKLLPNQLEAIEALINGEWDNFSLMEYGPLLENCNQDIKRIAKDNEP